MGALQLLAVKPLAQKHIIIIIIIIIIIAEVKTSIYGCIS
jgi:hypothetical protein